MRKLLNFVAIFCGEGMPMFMGTSGRVTFKEEFLASKHKS